MPIEHEIKQAKPISTTHQRLMVSLMFTGSWTKDIANRYLKQFGISSEQYNVLRILRGSNPLLLTVNDVQSRMMDKSSNVGRIVEKLLEKGLVNREINPKNRRVTNLSITENGLTFLAEIDTDFHKIEDRMKSLSIEESNQLIELLDKLRG